MTSRHTMIMDTRTEVVLSHIQDATPEQHSAARRVILGHSSGGHDIVEILGIQEDEQNGI